VIWGSKLEAEQLGRDLYLKYQQAGKTWIREHRVWDADRFFRSQLADGLKQEEVTLVTVSDRDEYRSTTWNRK